MIIADQSSGIAEYNDKDLKTGGRTCKTQKLWSSELEGVLLKIKVRREAFPRQP